MKIKNGYQAKMKRGKAIILINVSEVFSNRWMSIYYSKKHLSTGMPLSAFMKFTYLIVLTHKRGQHGKAATRLAH